MDRHLYSTEETISQYGEQKLILLKANNAPKEIASNQADKYTRSMDTRVGRRQS